jgi:hypothetical protein
MAWRLRYSVNLDYVPEGVGPTAGLISPPVPGGGASNYTLAFFQDPVSGPVAKGTGTTSPGGNQLASADITALLAALSTDLDTQLNAALGTVNNWVIGGVA